MLPALSLLAPVAAQVVGDVAGSSVGYLPADTNAAGSASFSQVLGQVTNDAITSLKSGESAAISGIQGNMPVQQVVEQVMGAQQSLQTALAIRDKLVAAYQEVSRMAI